MNVESEGGTEEEEEKAGEALVFFSVDDGAALSLSLFASPSSLSGSLLARSLPLSDRAEIGG